MIEKNRNTDNSDATLSCPFCFTVLSYDCQQYIFIQIKII